MDIRGQKGGLFSNRSKRSIWISEAELFRWTIHPTHTQCLTSHFPLHFIYKFMALTSFLKLLTATCPLGFYGLLETTVLDFTYRLAPLLQGPETWPVFLYMKMWPCRCWEKLKKDKNQILKQANSRPWFPSSWEWTWESWHVISAQKKWGKGRTSSFLNNVLKALMATCIAGPEESTWLARK